MNATAIEIINSVHNDSRRESLRLAVEAGVGSATLRRLATAERLAKSDSIVLPTRYLHLSRGKGWARLGTGDAAQWGVEEQHRGYRVSSPGKWTVFSSDGFKREERVIWTVTHVDVGGQTWTIAN